MNQEVIEILDTHLYGQYAPGTSAIKAYWESVFEQPDGVSSLSDIALTTYMSFFRLGLKNLATRQNQADACRSADDTCVNSRLNSGAVTLNYTNNVEIIMKATTFVLRRRRFEPVGFPLSVHLYFYDDRFQGYLVRQEVQAVGSDVKETLEMWAVPQTTFILEPNLKEFERLKNLEVSVLFRWLR